jgi:NAD(P)-dependent dehydrogenase (short-subunit alcohol dehydrogenase family)
MDKVMLITGASRGIGRAVALALAAPGAHLVLVGRDGSTLEPVAAAAREAGAQATPIACDITAEPHVRRMIETSAALTGQIDVLVNNAGSAIVTPFAEMTLAEWETILRTTLTGTFLACRHAVGHMQEGGLIINIASIAARQAFPGWAAYSAAKYGLVGFSNAIREELRPRGVRVTVVYPAATDTPLWDSIPGEWNRANMLQPEEVARPIANLVEQPPHVNIDELGVGHVAGAL